MIEGTITFPSVSARHGTRAQKARYARGYRRAARDFLRRVVKATETIPPDDLALFMRRNGWDVKKVDRKAWLFKKSILGVETIVELREV